MTATINTYTDPGADPAHEWKQPAPEVTPALLLACADYVFETGVDASVAHALRGMAEELEAESARDEEAERYAELYHLARRHRFPTLAKWDALPAHNQADYIRIMRAVLDWLAADGCPLPGDAPVPAYLALDLWQAIGIPVEKFDAYFERNGWGDTWATLLGAVRDSFGRKCEKTTSGGEPCVLAEHSVGPCMAQGDVGTHDQLPFAPPAVPVPDGGPDGTPEKPWPTWQDVPEGVVYADNEGDQYVNRGGVRWKVRGDTSRPPRQCGLDSYWLNERCAPFVRVDGDKA